MNKKLIGFWLMLIALFIVLSSVGYTLITLFDLQINTITNLSIQYFCIFAYYGKLKFEWFKKRLYQGELHYDRIK